MTHHSELSRRFNIEERCVRSQQNFNRRMIENFLLDSLSKMPPGMFTRESTLFSTAVKMQIVEFPVSKILILQHSRAWVVARSREHTEVVEGARENAAEEK